MKNKTIRVELRECGCVSEMADECTAILSQVPIETIDSIDQCFCRCHNEEDGDQTWDG